MTRTTVVGMLLVGLSACAEIFGPTSLVRFVAVDGKDFGTCGVTSVGDVRCWGWMETSGAADPNFAMTFGWTATRVPGVGTYRSVARGYTFVCAVSWSNEAFCAGESLVGELGHGANTSSREFVPVAGDHRWRMISAGWFHMCGIRVEGDAYCWGNQFLGGLGNGEVDGYSPVPVPVASDARFISIAAGGAFTCAIDTEGLLWCWGKASSGETAHGDPIAPPPAPAVPTRGATDTRFVSVVAGGDYACALARDGRVWCWGRSDHGQIGRGTTTPSATPQPVAGGRRYLSLSSGSNMMCANGVDGVADCWGIELHTSFGDPPPPAPALVPTRVRFPWLRFAEVRAVARTRCGRTFEGLLYCWGEGRYGQLGDGSNEVRRLAPTNPVVSR